MIEVLIAGVALHGAGLPGWQSSLPILRGEQDWQNTTLVLPPPAILPANERRRTNPLVRLSLLASGDAVAMSGISPARLRLVFASSSGDGDTVCGILDALSRDESVSPTAFHNSVHNAPSGYWSIGQASMQPATCVGLYNDTFSAALIKAIAETQAEHEPVLLCAADLPVPAPLDALRPVVGGLGIALVLLPGDETAHALARLRLHQIDDAPTSGAAWPEIATGNPVGSGWPLLAALATRNWGMVSVPWRNGSLRLELLPC